MSSDIILSSPQPTNTPVLVIRRWLLFFIIGLFISGLTAFPIETLLRFTLDHWPRPYQQNPLFNWMMDVYFALADINLRYPFLAYGTDWLAFAHMLFTILFIGVWRYPRRNCWIIDFGLIACATIPLLAFTAGSVRHIPVFWRLIDSSFGIIGAIPLWIIRKKIKLLPDETT